jgi:hypothetical protein
MKRRIFALQSESYLFMSKAQLMLEDGFSIRQDLNLVGQSVESVGQRMSKMKLVHAHDKRVGCEEKGRKKKKVARQCGQKGFEGSRADIRRPTAGFDWSLGDGSGGSGGVLDANLSWLKGRLQG